MKHSRLMIALALCHVGCMMPVDDEPEVAVTAQALTDPLPEFPFRVLPVWFHDTSNRCLTVLNAGTANDTELTNLTCSASSKHQKWYLIRQLDNSYQIRTGHIGGKLLSIRNASLNDGEKAQIYDITTAANTRWEVVPNGVGFYRLKNVNSGKCLVLGSRAAQTTCASATSLRIAPNYSFPFSIAARHSGKCLNVAGASNANNANVQQYECVGAANERWFLEPDSTFNPSWYYIKSLNSGKCLDIAGGALGNNGNAQQYDCTGVDNERWRIQPTPSAGEFYIRNVRSGRCLTVADASLSNNANVDQFDCVGGLNQKWQWNNFAQKTVRRVIPNTLNGAQVQVSDADWNRNLTVAQNVLHADGIRLVHNAATHRHTFQSDALRNLGLTDNMYSDCPVGTGLKTPYQCADLVARTNWPNDIVMFLSRSTGGSSSGDWSFVQLANGPWADQCSSVGDSCSDTGNDNSAHIAHELGHYLGMPHTFDDYLADTPDDPQAAACSARSPNPPAVSNNVMGYYYPCQPTISRSQGIMARVTSIARWAGSSQ
jgi:hypothetical protein